MGEIEFVEDPLVFEIRRDAVIVKWSTGLRQAIPLDIFRENCRRANAALDEWAEAHVNNVVRLRRGRAKK